MEKILIIGSGFLGSYVLKEFQMSGIKGIGTHFHHADEEIVVDIRNINSINKLVLKIKPDLIVNCAANTQIDFLEDNPDLAFSINSHGAGNVAKVCQQNKIKLIHISTDGVFDGTKGWYSEKDIPNPVNVYAKSKILAEELVKEHLDNHIIIRTNFFGLHSNNKYLFNWILNTLKENKPLIGFSDVIFTPLEISNLSKMILELSMLEYTGIIHLASNEAISKYDFATKIAEIFNLDKDLIKKDSIDNFTGFVAKRPKNTTLLNNKARSLLHTQIIPITEWLNKIKQGDDLVK